LRKKIPLSIENPNVRNSKYLSETGELARISPRAAAIINKVPDDDSF
jgi:hypothetical protein